jgi:hypothetical protein
VPVAKTELRYRRSSENSWLVVTDRVEDAVSEKDRTFPVRGVFESPVWGKAIDYCLLKTAVGRACGRTGETFNPNESDRE